MIELPQHLIESPSWKHTSNDAIVCYLTMRADAQFGQTEIARQANKANKRISGLNNDVLSETLGVPPLTVIRLQNELVKRKWITPHDSGYQLGEANLWYADSAARIEAEAFVAPAPAPPKPVSPIATLLASAALYDCRDKEVTATDVRKLFQSLYHEKYDEDAPMVSEGTANEYAMTTMYVARAVKWSNGDGQRASDGVRFMFEHWDRLCNAMGLDGRESLHMVGSSKIWNRLLWYMDNGLPAPRVIASDVTNRAETKEPVSSIGW